MAALMRALACSELVGYFNIFVEKCSETGQILNVAILETNVILTIYI